MNPQEQKEFDEKFIHPPFGGVMPQHRDGGVTLARDLKAFITSLLSKRAEKLVEAWNNEGINPQYHREVKERLKGEWPSLYKSIDNFIQDNK